MQSIEANSKSRCLGRPPSFRRADLVREVTDLFWQHGYQNLSLNQIASATGLSRASLYNAFETKESLFLECMDFYISTSPTACLDECRPGDSVGPMLYGLLERISELRANDKKNRGCLAANTISELAASNTELGKAILASQSKRARRMTRLIRQAIEQGELADDTDADTTAQIILAFMNGLSSRSKTGAGKVKLTKMSRLFLQRMGFERPS